MIFRRFSSLAIAITIFVTGCTQSSQGSAPSASGSPGAATPTGATVHSTPVCAVQDCVTHKIVDNGCTPSGECASCINFCPPQGSITVTPSITSATPSAKHP